MKRALVMALGLFIAACGGGEHQDLKEELKKLTAGLRGKVSPLPVVKPYEPVAYKAFDLVEPFDSSKIELVTKAASSGGGLKPDLNRPKEPLEAFPLESIQMVGTLSQNKDMFALMRAGANLFRVKKGNYMGQNFGVITGIDEGQISLKEVVQDSGGDWVERSTSLQMQEGRR